MNADDIIETRIKPIAKDGFSDAIEILQLIALLRAQNSNNVNKGLSKAGAGRSAMTARNALVARLTLLVARAYAKPRPNDRHIRQAFDLIAKDTRVSEELAKRASPATLQDAQAIWFLCRDDNRRQRIEHFRDKHTAHLGESDETIPLPKYEELFEFAIETAKVMEALAKLSGVEDNNLSDLKDQITDSADVFWKPWVC